MALQPDGKVLIGGDFSLVKGVSRNGIARLNANGTFDSTFNPGSGVNGLVDCVVVQPDAKILIGGTFTNFNGVNRNRIARLHADGSLDSGFNPGTGPNGTVRSIALQPDGNMLIGGSFFTVNGVVRPHIARLYGDSSPPQGPQLNIQGGSNKVVLSWPANATGFRLQSLTNLTAANNWANVTGTPSVSGSRFYVTNAASQSRIFYRLVSP